MFGYLEPNFSVMAPDDKQRYSLYYCGLCKALSDEYGELGSTCLTYDMTFLGMLLSALYVLDERHQTKRCIPQPIKKHDCVMSEAVAYAADLNIILSYYQAMDDWSDDKNIIARQRAQKLKPLMDKAKLRWPCQSAAIENSLEALGRMEKANELNPDIPANCFGYMMGELFHWKDDEHADTLRRIGAALGRYIYLLDARNDIEDDLKKQRYNPLVAQLSSDYKPILTMLMGECTEAFERLPIARDLPVLRNVLYSGVWQKYKLNATEKH